uniref:BLOC-1-related complex subunit 7 n=1 Tax=Romanomermis culicivorax TaxID=13658 RepID=A0A915IQ19_ROMCU
MWCVEYLTSLCSMSKASNDKNKLPQKIQDSITDCATIFNQVIKGSKCAENVMTTVKNFALQEAAMENSDNGCIGPENIGSGRVRQCSESLENLKRMASLVTHLKAQADDAQVSVQLMSETQDRMALLEKTKYLSRQKE